jgi:hypothetical protein
MLECFFKQIPTKIAKYIPEVRLQLFKAIPYKNKEKKKR